MEDTATEPGINEFNAVATARNWARIATWLVGTTLVYNVIEAVVALWSGARADSIALLGFGLDSVIECAAAIMLLWRLTAQTRSLGEHSVEAAERRVQRFVGLTFFALAIYVVAQAGWSLWHREMSATSRVGIVLALASLIIMPLLAGAKIHAATKLGSAALRAEAKETLACSYLSFTLLLGLVANAAMGWWWADPVAALLMTPWLVKEGIEGVQGERS